MFRLFKSFLIVVFALPLYGFVDPLPEKPLPQQTTLQAPKIKTNPKTGEKELRLSVLTYNVAALPFPLRFGRKKALADMGYFLRKLRTTGIAPDVVLLQEAFDAKALKEFMKFSGYPNYIHGATRADKAPKLTHERAQNFKRHEYFLNGEGWGKATHSGLAILSTYPIVAKYSQPFRYCAGWDCLANKGVVAAEIQVAGMPVPLLVANTHLNAGAAADVPFRRSLFAHNLQIDVLKNFTKKTWDKQMPLIFGGDFNIRNKEARLKYAMNTLGKDVPYILPRFYCAEVSTVCEIRLNLEGGRPWARTQDLQGFANGSRVTVEPVRIQAMFDGGVFGEALSDHDGYLVEYVLRWK